MFKDQLIKFKQDVLDKIVNEDEKAYIVGGACRDMLDDMEIKDIDICTTDKAGFVDRLMKFGRQNGFFPSLHHMKHADNIRMILPEHLRLSPYGNDMYVEVEVSDYVKDEEIYGGNRDFLCNAIHWQLGPGKDEQAIQIKGRSAEGSIYKWDDHMLELVYEDAFKDNPLRIWRCADMMCRPNIQWRPTARTSKLASITMDNIIREDSVGRLNESCTQILNKIIGEMAQGLRDWKYVRNAFNWLMDVGGWYLIHPRIHDMGHIIHWSKWHKDSIWQHTMDVMEGVDKIIHDQFTHYNFPINISNGLYWAALLHDVGKVEKISYDEDGTTHFYEHELASCDIAGHILIYTQDQNYILKLILYHMDTKMFHEDKLRRKDYRVLRRLLYNIGDEHWVDAWIVLNTADCWASLRYNREFPAQKPTIDAIWEILINIDNKLEPNWFKYKEPVTGAEVQAELHCDPKMIKPYLDQIRSVAMADPTRMATKEQALAYIHTLGREWKEKRMKELEEHKNNRGLKTIETYKKVFRK